MTDWLLFLGEDIEFKEVPKEVLAKVRDRFAAFEMTQVK